MEKYDLTTIAVSIVMASAIIVESTVTFHSISSTLPYCAKLAGGRTSRGLNLRTL